MPDRLDRRLRKIRRRLRRKVGLEVRADRKNDSILLTGEVGNWDEKVTSGYTAAGHGFRGIINDIRVRGLTEPEMTLPSFSDDYLEGREFDVVVIGGGVIGCTVARELSRKDISIAILEKEYDLAMQASGRNDGMIHPGFAPSPGTKMAAYNARGNRLYTALAEELDFEIKRPGSIILFDSIWKNLLIPVFRRRCRQNGVAGEYRRLSSREVVEMEPSVTERQRGGFLLPSAGIVSPYKVTIALAENAVQNGAEVFLKTAVTGMETRDGRIFRLRTNRGMIRCGAVVNAAGVWADTVAGMAGDRFFSIHGRKGTDAILDRECTVYQNHILGMPPLLGKSKNHSKGGGVVPCIEGNILLGPTAQEVPDREDYSTDSRVFNDLLKQLALNRNLNRAQVINYYSGIRAANWEEDFIIEPSRKLGNLIHAAAIQSPGLASAPAIGEDVARMTLDALQKAGMEIRDRKGFEPVRRGIPSVKNLTGDERTALIRKDPEYGEIICRCEEISRGEVRDAIRSLVPATTVDGVKRRVRAGAGRCHGGFCQPRIVLCIAEELGVPIPEITKKNGTSRILIGEIGEGEPA